MSASYSLIHASLIRASLPALRLGLVCTALLALSSAPTAASTPARDPDLQAMEWREIGPFRGGRSAAVAGIPDDSQTYYFGATGGGVWKTTDAGGTWKPVSDGFFGGSIGAVAVSQWDPNVLYAGGGEKTIRGNVSHGDGMWKSTDAGRTWTFKGLKDSRHIPRIRIHPRNPDLVYAAVLGHLFAANAMRGIYRSRDGGENWEKILFAGEEAGAVDLAMDPTNPRILYASLWNVQRTPYSLSSGGPGSGLWKSIDGGDTWEELTGNEGLPEGTWGISGISVSRTDPDNLYAIVEAQEGGVFRSRDAGETWTRTNSERKLRQRAWYYSRVVADPTDTETVYVLNVRFQRSKDGGKTFTAIDVPHGDNHDLWIAPDDPLRMIESNDGGANVSFDGGKTWSPQNNQPTAQFYRVTTDNHFPYRIYGAQQDNSTVRILHRAPGGSIGVRDWEPTAGGESGHIAIKPDNSEIVYGGSYGGFLTRVNHANHQVRAVNIWPVNPMGWGAAELRYRFQWNFPLFFSPHDKDVLYAAADVLFKTTDEGQSWQAISPDLTRNDKSRQAASGGPITRDNTGVEYYATIFAAVESPLQEGLIWTGSDDGLLHLTRDGGGSWTDVTPKGLPEWAMINSLEADPFRPGGLYLAATRYKLDDFTPYLYRTTDFGKTWKRIDKGIPRDHFTRVVRADRTVRGLLYAGTERGVYFSNDDGASWRPLQLGLPISPVTDLALKDDDLIAATQGRGFWVLDDLTPLQQMVGGVPAAPHLFTPRPAYRLRDMGRREESGAAGSNPAPGLWVHYSLPEVDEETVVRIQIIGSDDDVVRTWEGTLKPPRERQAEAQESDEAEADPTAGGEKDDDDEEESNKLEKLKPGLNRFVWDLRYEGPEKFAGMILWAGMTNGPMAVPGAYQVRLRVGDSEAEDPAVLQADPRSSSSQADLEAQFDFLMAVRDKLTQTHKAIAAIRRVRGQVKDLRPHLKGLANENELTGDLDDFLAALKEIEEALYQTKNQSRQDPLNFPIRLNNKLSSLARMADIGDFRPTQQAEEVREELTGAIDEQLDRLDEIWAETLPRLNQRIRAAGVPALFPEPGSEVSTEETQG